MSQPKNYSQLIIQVSLKEFSFVIKNILNGEHLEFHRQDLQATLPLEEQLERIFSQCESLRQQHDEVLVLHNNALNTFVPQAVFNENTLAAYLQYTTKVFATDFFAYDELDLYQMNNVYVPYISVNNFLLDKLGAFVYQNIHTVLVAHLLRDNPNNGEIFAYAHLQEGRFELVVLKNDQLLLFNSYEYQTPEDFIYYILFVYEQLELNPESNALILLGSVDTESAYYQMAYTYIRTVSIKTNPQPNPIESSLAAPLNSHYILFQS
ncbi:DUF3822 family protein [Flavobacterium sp. JP2137]|uniref:DUF3822 family protein n=1 Tax=Flavobacterium sp. JP2137 TaxID=3414510 RepID=UPI003D2FED2D